MIRNPDRPADDDAALRALYAASLAADVLDAHPTEDDWERLATGAATADERARLGDHVVRCAACADVFRVVTRLEADAALVDPAAVSHMTATGAEAESPTEVSRPVPVVRASMGPWLAAAAPLALAAGSGWWAWSLNRQVGALQGQLAAGPQPEDLAALEVRLRDMDARASALARELADAQQPGLNVPIVDLLPDQARGAAPAPAVVRVPPGARFVTVIVTLAAPLPSQAALTVEIVAADGRSVGAWPGVRPGRYGTSSIVVPATLLPAGRYTVRLLTQAGRLVQSHAIAVEHPAAEAR